MQTLLGDAFFKTGRSISEGDVVAGRKDVCGRDTEMATKEKTQMLFWGYLMVKTVVLVAMGK